ncbi:MAG: hypothetical protein Ta2E_03480 [Mycoplasmoidaceae bacterium]|nr:MAG: hypothetical protein Ta2E_03480 [Mycoplasmoidaceae bacterium]
MASKKGTGSTKNGRDSNPCNLGCKLYDGQEAKAGMIIYRQRGNKIFAGKNVGQGKDHTLFALKPGKVKFSDHGPQKRVEIITAGSSATKVGIRATKTPTKKSTRAVA